MDIIGIFLISVGLAMDAFAVSVCKGTALKTPTIRQMIWVGLWFGVFQGLMPIIGYSIGSAIYDTVSDYGHWIAFGILAIIGLQMIRESFSEEEDETGVSLYAFTMLVLAVATSIDALAVGVTFAMDDSDIALSSLMIGVVTFVISVLGVKIGSLFGTKFDKYATIFGGTVLIVIGLNMILEHYVY